jgi:hypothetical protein
MNYRSRFPGIRTNAGEPGRILKKLKRKCRTHRMLPA